MFREADEATKEMKKNKKKMKASSSSATASTSSASPKGESPAETSPAPLPKSVAPPVIVDKVDSEVWIKRPPPAAAAASNDVEVESTADVAAAVEEAGEPEEAPVVPVAIRDSLKRRLEEDQVWSSNMAAHVVGDSEARLYRL